MMRAVRVNRQGVAMMWRLLGGMAGLFCAFPAAAAELTPEQARQFVIGKTFLYRCFEGTQGAGRVSGDGAVMGTIQMQGSGPVRVATLPANTLQVRGAKICAAVKGMPFEPCFDLQQTGARSFRGSVSGFGFAYCDFTQYGRSRGRFLRTATGETGKSAGLRSSLAD